MQQNSNYITFFLRQSDVHRGVAEGEKKYKIRATPASQKTQKTQNTKNRR